MTCRDVMTPNPVCCTPEEPALRAAEIMRSEDVGPVPVVSSSDRRVVGIVTDRDLAIRLIAEGRAPEATPVSDVMTRNPVSCREDDDIHEALNTMSRQQVRRIPVVDNEGRLCGIIAQADIARYLDEEQAGEVLEDISQPGRSTVGRAFRQTGQAVRRNIGGSAWIALGVGAAIGAGIMALVGQRRSELTSRPSTREMQSYQTDTYSGADDITGSYL